MIKFVTKKLFFTAALLVFASFLACGAKMVPSKVQFDCILASVNGQSISLLDVLNESRPVEARLTAVYRGQVLYDEIEKLRRKILEDIIARKLLISEYDRDPFPITEQMIENLVDELALNHGCTSREELKKLAERSGIDMEKLRTQAKEKLITQGMISGYLYKTVNLTPREVYEYYKKHYKEFSTPAQVHLQLLCVADDSSSAQTCKKLSEKLKDANEKIFKAMTVLYSSGPNAAAGGDVGWIAESRLRSEFAEALKGHKVSDIVGPVKTAEGSYFIRLAGRKKPEGDQFRKIAPELRKKIVGKMHENAYKKYIEKLKKESFVRYYM